jgi:MFS family permease
VPPRRVVLNGQHEGTARRPSAPEGGRPRLPRVRRIVYLTSAVVFFDTLFFVALTPLLPHYAVALGLGKAGAGVLSAAYPAGCLLGAIPSGMVAARAGVKPTVLVGLTVVGLCTVLFGFGDRVWELDLARFCQGIASAFSWTGTLAWLVAVSPPGRRGALIGQAFATAVAGALFGPVLGGVASVAGTGWTFGSVGVASFGLVAWAALTPSERPVRPQGVSALFRALGDRRIVLGCWFVVLPSLLFGLVSVLGPLRLSVLGFGAIAIGATFLCSAAFEAANNLFVGRVADRHGPLLPIRVGLAVSIACAAVLPWPRERFVLAAVIVVSELAFGTFFAPSMTLLTHLSEERGLDYGYTFAIISLAWAPGQAIGAAGGGALAHATADAYPYLILAGACALTLAAVQRGAAPRRAPRSRS